MSDFLPAPRSMSEAKELAQMIASTKLIPANFQGKPNEVLVAMMWSSNLGVPALQGIQGIAVINGKPAIYGDLAIAVVRKSGKCKYVKESVEGTGDQMRAICEVERVDEGIPHKVSFSVGDAKIAGLWGKSGPWKNYPKRMLQMRARGFALRDAFPDVLMGMVTVEEAMDTEEMVIGPDGELTPASQVPKKPSKPARKSAKTKEPLATEEAAEETKLEEEPKQIENDPTPPFDLTSQQGPVAEPELVKDEPITEIPVDVMTQIDDCRSKAELRDLYMSLSKAVKAVAYEYIMNRQSDLPEVA